jgi:hypothetical protein
VSLTSRQRIVAGCAAVVCLAGVAVAYVLVAGASSRAAGSSPVDVVAPTGSPGFMGPAAAAASVNPTPVNPAAVSANPSATSVSGAPALALGGRADLIFVNKTEGPQYGRVAVTSREKPAADRTQSDLDCARVYAAADRVLCLQPTGELAPAYRAVIMDGALRVQKVLDLSGIPSRARLSADGNIASWTVFVSGDSYLSVGFSTRTSVVDLRSGEVVDSLETFSIVKDGQPYSSADVNFWGVTVAKDDRLFYATMSTKGQTYLVEGDLQQHRVTTIATNVECPSLSPDNTRLVFKKRVDAEDGRQPWRLWVLDLRTMAEKPLTEDRSVDDQAAWLDDATIAYSLPLVGTSTYDTWTVPASGSGAPALLLRGASSPSPLTLPRR